MTNSPFTTIALILLMVVAFYFLILRPQKKRQQAQQKTMNELTPGTRVLLGSGLFGTISWVGSKQAILEVAPGVEMTVLKQAIARVVTPGDEYSEPVDMIDEPDDPSRDGRPRLVTGPGAPPASHRPGPRRGPATDRRQRTSTERPSGPPSGPTSGPRRADLPRLGNDLSWQHQGGHPGRILIVLGVIVAALFGLMALSNNWTPASRS